MHAERCFRVKLEYDGTEFAGFQLQARQRSVQGVVEDALLELTGSPVRVHGAGRTDAGVHALGQVVSFRAATGIPTERLCAALNGALPPDAGAVEAEETDEGFHARFSATGRSYVYVILNRPCRSAMLGRYCWHVPKRLDVGTMAAGASMLLGTQDFRAWANEVREVRSTVRAVSRCSVRRRKDLVLVRVDANAFLHGMVRNVVGTLVDVGLGKRPAEYVAEVTASHDRRMAGASAPARGLCLLRVSYQAPRARRAEATG